jgi:haloalkane dehalogenase
MNTVLAYGDAQRGVVTPWFQWIGKLHEAGTLHEVLGNLGSTILSVMKIIGFQNSAAVNQTWIRAYSTPFPDKKSCIGAIEFPLDAFLRRIREYMLEGVNGVNALKKKPAMLAVGLEDYAIDPEQAINDFKGLYPNAPVVTLPGVGHFCQEDAPQTLIALIQQFIQMTA